MRLDLVDVETARLALPLRARLAEAGRDRDDHRLLAAARDLELAPLAHRCLVDVPGEDQVGAARDECAENVVPAGDRLLPRAPRRADQVVVEHDDLECAGRRFCRRSSARASCALRMPPGLVRRHGRTELRPTTCRVGERVGRLGRLPLALELSKRAGEASREGVRDVVIARNRQHGPAERVEKP